MSRMLPVTLVFGLALGCGGDDDSGVDPTKALSAITVAEATAICEATYGSISDADLIKVGCYLAGLAAPPGDCETVAAACLAAPADEAVGGCDLPERVTTSSWPACAAQVTVGAMEACARAIADNLGAIAAQLSCSSPPPMVALPMACNEAKAACPDLFNRDSNDEPQPGAR